MFLLKSVHLFSFCPHTDPSQMVECNGHFDGPIPPYGTAIRRRGHAGETAKKRNGKETKLTKRRRIPRCPERSERRRKANGPERENIIIATCYSNNPQTAGRHVHTASRIPDSPRTVNGSSRGKNFFERQIRGHWYRKRKTGTLFRGGRRSRNGTGEHVRNLYKKRALPLPLTGSRAGNGGERASRREPIP